MTEPNAELREQRSDSCEHCQRSVEIRARRLILEHYDADLYKRALEDHMKVCTRPMVIQAFAPTPKQLAEAARKTTEYFLEGESKTRIAHHAAEIERILTETLK